LIILIAVTQEFLKSNFSSSTTLFFG